MTKPNSNMQIFERVGGSDKPPAKAPSKVSIGSLDDTGLNVVAHYNPSTVTITKAVPWSKVNEANQSNQQSSQGQGIHMEFTGANGRETAIDLLFDEVEKPDGSVAKAIAALEKMASVRKPGSTKEDERRPHHCVVVWGNTFQQFSCVIKNLSTKYQMFSATGDPIRATVTVTLSEADSVGAGKSGGSGSTGGT